MFMLRIPFFTAHAEAENSADRARDHPFLVRMNDADRNPACCRRDHILIRRVSLFFEFDPQKSQPFADPGTDRGRVLSDATSEHQRVQSAQRRRECADPFLDLVAKQRDRFSRPHVLRFAAD